MEQQDGQEYELKFQLSESKVALLRESMGERGARTTARTDHYFDTAALDLAGAGMSLRLRDVEGAWVQTLKSGGMALASRGEHEVELAPPPPQPLAPDLSRHASSRAARSLTRALKHANEPALLEMFEVRARRSTCVVKTAGSEIEIALDEGEIEAQGRSVPICEVEFECKAGDRRDAFRLAESWIAPGRLWLNHLSKADRGVTLARGDTTGPPTKARTPEVDGTEDGQRLLRLALQSTLTQVLVNAGNIALGGEDAERIHQLRVGLRRTRTALRDLCPPGMSLDASWEPALADAFHELGAIRDNETVATLVEPLLEKAHAPLSRWEAPRNGRAAGAIVTDPRLQAVLLGLVELADLGSPVATVPEPKASAWKRVERRLGRLHRQILAASKDFEQLPLAKQHQSRKRLKRLRYLVEFVGARWPKATVKRYLSVLEPAQDALGTHIDIATAWQKFLADADRDQRAFFAAGFLQSRRELTAKDAGKALRRLRRAKPFWR